MDQQWPEGPNADPHAARERYHADLRTSRAAVRQLFRVQLPLAHLGLMLAAVATAFVSVLWSTKTGMIIAGAFAALFAVATAVALLSGRRGWGAARAAYTFTFGWVGWITP